MFTIPDIMELDLSSKPKIKMVDGVLTARVTANEINGENERRSHAYQLILLIVSSLAMFKNFTVALFLKLFVNRNKSNYARLNST